MNNYFLQNNIKFEGALALKIGLNESIFLNLLNYWLQRSKNCKDDKIWVFNTLSKWCEQLPIFSERTLQRLIKKLKNSGIIEVQKHDKNRFNRTNWYTINYEKLELLYKDEKLENSLLRGNKSEQIQYKERTNWSAQSTNYAQMGRSDEISNRDEATDKGLKSLKESFTKEVNSTLNKSLDGSYKQGNLSDEKANKGAYLGENFEKENLLNNDISQNQKPKNENPSNNQSQIPSSQVAENSLSSKDIKPKQTTNIKTKSYKSSVFHNQILGNEKSYIKPSKEQEEFYSSEFLEFWKNYPKTEGKQVAFLEFKKLNKYEQEMAIKTALMYAKDKETIEAKYIKNASNWLRDRCFDDYGLEEVNKVNEKNNFIENLNKKIIALFTEDLDLNKAFFEQENSLGIVFSKNEKYILKELNMNLDDYKDLNFQNGKLLSFLKLIIE